MRARAVFVISILSLILLAAACDGGGGEKEPPGSVVPEPTLSAFQRLREKVPVIAPCFSVFWDSGEQFQVLLEKECPEAKALAVRWFRDNGFDPNFLDLIWVWVPVPEPTGMEK